MVPIRFKQVPNRSKAPYFLLINKVVITTYTPHRDVLTDKKLSLQNSKNVRNDGT